MNTPKVPPVNMRTSKVWKIRKDQNVHPISPTHFAFKEVYDMLVMNNNTLPHHTQITNNLLGLDSITYHADDQTINGKKLENTYYDILNILAPLDLSDNNKDQEYQRVRRMTCARPHTMPIHCVNLNSSKMPTISENETKYV
jgi:hypothetical protein